MAQAEAPYVLHVISHTHWDREWYLPFEQFRLRLVDLVDQLLDLLERDPDFRYFHLDAQTVVLEDYLELRPQNRERLKRLVREGRLLIGPWYLQSDLYLTSGESLVRNLLLGRKLSEEFGGCMQAGYLPDQFGLPGQVPQVLRGFGLDTAVFGRGRKHLPGRKCEFKWRAPNGDEVLAVHMAYWYNNAQRFPSDLDEAERFVRELKAKLSECAGTRHLLLMNGVDHLVAQEDLSRIMKGLQPRLAPDELVHSTLPEYLAAVKAELTEDLETVTGELLEDSDGMCLQGTHSARVELKQQNFACEQLLCKYVEPLMCMAAESGFKIDKQALEYAWKTLLQCQPHDSICGCSSDETHQDMPPRFRHVQQVGSSLVERALRHLGAGIKPEGAGEGDEQLLVFNPLPQARTRRVEALVEVPLERKEQAFELWAGAEQVPYDVLEVKPGLHTEHKPTELPQRTAVKQYKIAFTADLPAVGVRSFTLRPVEQAPRFKQEGLRRLDLGAENEFLRFQILPDGSCTLLDKRTGLTYGPLNYFIDGGDFGDEYLYRAPASDRIIDSRGQGFRLSRVQEGPNSLTYVLDYELLLPETSTEEGRSERLVACPISTELTLTRGVARLDIKTTVENRAREHRLRVCFATGAAIETSLALGQFDIVERPRTNPPEWQPVADTSRAQYGWCAAADATRGLLVASRGLCEYELYEDADSTLAVTLLRATGALNRLGAAGPGVIEVEEAQCLGTYHFEYSVVPGATGELKVQALQEAEAFLAPPLALQLKTGSGERAAESSWLEVEPATLLLAAIKPALTSDAIVVRCYNPLEEAQKAIIRLPAGVQSVHRATLAEEPEAEISIEAEKGVSFVKLEVPAHTIVTLLIATGKTKSG